MRAYTILVEQSHGPDQFILVVNIPKTATPMFILKILAEF
jgi:hypothetical protein